MVTKVNLRVQNATPMTIAQGDESLIHLSNYEQVGADQDLHTGGVYDVIASCRLALPTDGNAFSIRVSAGTVTFDGGSVEGQNGATMAIGGLKELWRVGADWKVVSSDSDGAVLEGSSFTVDTTIAAGTQMYWINSATARTITIPDTLPEDHMFAVIRQNAVVNVVPSGAEQARDPDTGALDPAGFTLNEKGGAWFKKTNGHWDSGIMRS